MSDDLVKRMNAARDFPNNTCPASRHAAMIAEALCLTDSYPMIEEEPEHCGESIASTVASLWECRAENARLREALDIDFIEQAISDVLSEGGTYRDAAEYVARTTLAELKGAEDADRT